MAAENQSEPLEPSAAASTASSSGPPPCPGVSGGPGSPSAGGDTDIQGYIQAHAFDERAAFVLRDSSPQVQQMVLANGPIVNANNPSSALMAMIKKAQTGSGKGWAGDSWTATGNATAFNDIEGYIQAHAFDERAIFVLRDSAPQVQQMVLANGPISNASNPSSALMAMIKKAQSGSSWGGDGSQWWSGGDPRGGEGEPSDNLYICGLPKTFTSDKVNQFFSAIGNVQECKSFGHGFALVRFASMDEAAMVKETLDGQQPAGCDNALRITFSVKKAAKGGKGGKGCKGWKGWNGEGGGEGDGGSFGKAGGMKGMGGGGPYGKGMKGGGNDGGGGGGDNMMKMMAMMMSMMGNGGGGGGDNSW